MHPFPLISGLELNLHFANLNYILKTTVENHENKFVRVTVHKTSYFTKDLRSGQLYYYASVK